MRAFIVTISDYGNLGNRLQNYAVYKSLSDFGKCINGEQAKPKHYFIYLIKRIIMSVKNVPYFSKTIWKNKYKIYLFINFSKKIPTTLTYFIDNEEKMSRKFDLVFYGSDQIWNPEFGPENCIVPKTPKEKNIALCASIGADYIPKDQIKKYKEGLSRFSHISVREDKAADIVEELTGNRPVVLIDPTLSLDMTEWEKIECRPYYKSKKYWNNKKYIFLYFLGELSEARKSQIKELAEKHNADIVDATRGDICDYIGPAEFIWLIHNSMMVITDSYHGSIFSFIFDKAFYVLDREDTEIKMSMNSRFDTLFRKLDLYDRKNNNILEYICEHDYSRSYKLLESERKKYFDYIENVIQDIGA